jgi:predicted secreted protein
MADTGRGLLIKIAATAIAGARANSMTIDNSPVDITDIASGGFRELGSFSGQRSMDLSISGVWDDKVFRGKALAADTALLLTDCTLDFADGGDIAGNFFLASYEESGEHDGAVTFTATLQSSGTFTYTAAI